MRKVHISTYPEMCGHNMIDKKSRLGMIRLNVFEADNRVPDVILDGVLSLFLP
jgi:hypothetical protein